MIGNKFLSVAGAPEPTDAQFNYVTMLLHGDGTNGAQNNTFLDSSSNAFTITRNGNTTQGSFSPYGSGWSNSFDGASTTKLTLPSSASFVLATNDFCIEAWVCGTPKAGYPRVVSFGPYYNDYNSTGIIFYDDSYSGYPSFYMNTARLMVGTSVLPTNQWTHIAVTRSGTTFRMFINGTQVATATSTASASNVTSIPIYVGNVDSTVYTGPITGNISNLRIVNGSAVYTSNFTPSTTPLTSITNTVLLTCQSNRFVDNSANAFAITPSSGTSVQRFNPFGTSTAYSTATIGGSAYYDGAGTLDYLSASGNSINIRTSVYTMEAWCYFQNPSSFYNEIFVGTLGSGTFQMVYNASSGRFYVSDAVTDTLNPLLNLSMNTWYHIALSFDGTTYKLFVNGVQQASSTTLLANQTITTLKVGGGYNGSITGYLSDARVLKGTALYTTTFTPPTAPLTAIANTSLLLNMTNGAIYDNAMMNDLETVGNAQISTSVKKYGTGSLAFDGTGDYLKPPFNQGYVFGTGDFTIEMWYYISATGTLQILFDFRQSNNGAYPYMYKNTDDKLYYYVNTAPRITGTTALSSNTWYHVAICRSGTSTKMFLNGVQEGSTWTDTTDYICNTTGPTIGSDNTFLYSINGYIDDLRITKGYARYTTTFTPPTSALADKSSS